MPISGPNDPSSNWYQTVEKARVKAQKYIKQPIALFQSTSIVVGKITAVEIDRLFKQNLPYCRITLSKPLRYYTDGKFEFKMGEIELFFVNKPEMVMTLAELNTRFPNVHEHVAAKVKAGEWS